MSKFIELRQMHMVGQIVVNVSHIIADASHIDLEENSGNSPESGCYMLLTGQSGVIDIVETYDKVKELIKEWGIS